MISSGVLGTGQRLPRGIDDPHARGLELSREPFGIHERPVGKLAM
jgi:hypothetical protein